MRRGQGRRWGMVVVPSAGILLALAPGVAGAAEAPADTRPERGISVYTEYSGVVVPVGETVRLELTVANKGRRDEIIALTLVSAPKDWKTELKGGGFTVTGVSVPDGKDRRLTFTAEPPKAQEPHGDDQEAPGRKRRPRGHGGVSDAPGVSTSRAARARRSGCR